MGDSGRGVLGNIVTKYARAMVYRVLSVGGAEGKRASALE